MSIPKFNEFHQPLLMYLKDGIPRSVKEINQHLAAYYHLTEKELSEVLPSGRQSVFSNRTAWSRVYLKKAGLIESSSRGVFQITDEGTKVLKENPAQIDNRYLSKYEGFREFQHSSKRSASDQENDVNETPDDQFEAAFQRINENLSDEVLSEVMKLSPAAFEQFVIDLLFRMGYGSFENAGKTTGAGTDEGIDGVIMEDRLGFSLIYIQAKKWDLGSTVGRPEVQSFVGAISGKGGKGLFVTTSRFTKQALEYAEHQHIILIDGKKLAKLMVEHNFGVRIKKTFEIKTVDIDIFNDYAER